MKEALKLIKKNKKTKSPILNLSNCGLINELPKQLFECVWIEQLNLGGGVYDLVNFSWVDTTRQYGNKNVFKGPELERLHELPN